MRIHDKKICLEYNEIVPAIMSSETYNKNRYRGNFQTIGRGGNGSEVLIVFDSLPPKYKALVIDKYGDPNQYLAKEPIAEQVKLNWDFAAEKYYRTFKLSDTRMLPETYVSKYTEMASWLKTINRFMSDKKALKRSLNITIAEFWENVTALIRSKDIALPTNARSLKNKLADFNQMGYDSLVETWRFGNDNRKKVKDEEAEDRLITMIEDPHMHDNTVIAAFYNQWALETGRETISPATVGYRRERNKNMIMLRQKGAAATYAALSKQIQRKRPSAPLLLVNSDDNVLDMFFIAESGKKKNYYYRPALYVVMDAYNDYILGWAIGETVTIELVKEAYRNAMAHVRELTGNDYMWNQIVTDHWAIDQKKEGALATFFSSQAHFTPATVKVAQSKYIERAFGVTWHQNLKLYPNYSGFNITAKERISTDAIEKAKKNFPSKDKAVDVVAHFITRMRQSINPKSGKTRQNEWLDAFEISPKSSKRLLDTEKRFELFGIQHKYTNKITTRGIDVTIDGVKHGYDVPEPLYLENVGKTISVTYDPYDFSQVLVTDGKGLRFIAEAVYKQPSALADFEEGDRTRLNSLLENKKQMMVQISTKLNERLDRMARNGIDAESLLQAGASVPKELAHAANKRISAASEYVDTEESTRSMW